MLEELKDFLFRGNIVDQFIAVGAAVFLFVVKPVQMMAARGKEPIEEGMPDEERRHQELLAALRARG